MRRINISRRINRWLARRPWKLFAFCLPALLAGVVLGMVALIVLFHHRQHDDLQQRYHRLTLSLLATGKFEAARVACLRGLSGGNNARDRLEWLFYLAVALNGLGQHQDAAALLATAAPLDHPGYVQAHLVVAQNLLNSTNLTTETLHTAEHHLLNALALDPQSEEVNELLGRFYINTHNPAKARVRLMKTYPVKPENALLLAICYAQETNGPAAIRWSDRAITAYEQDLLKAAPKYSPDDRLNLVRALMIRAKFAPPPETVGKTTSMSTNTAPQDSPAIWLGIVRLLLINGKYAAALETLDQQMRVSPTPAYSPAIAEVCAAWAGNISPGQKNGVAERLKLIQKGLTNAPENLQLQLMLVQTTHTAGETGLAAKKLLDQLMAGATGEAAAWWHFLLWTDARIRGDLVTARRHLQTAYELAPQIPQIKNDLAMEPVHRQSGGLGARVETHSVGGGSIPQ